MKNVVIGRKEFKKSDFHEGLQMYEVTDQGKKRYALISQVSLKNMQRNYSLDYVIPGSNVEIIYLDPETGVLYEEMETIIV